MVGALTAVLATLIVGLLFGPITAISGGLQYMLLGWVLGYMLYHHRSGSKTIQAVSYTHLFNSWCQYDLF